jgi:hypothetical protein
MNRFFRKIWIVSFIMVFLFSNPSAVLADEGDGGHGLVKEVNGYHVTLASQDEWVKGGNTIVVTLTDSMGMPISQVDVEILIIPRSDEHAEDLHGVEPQQDPMPGMSHDHSQETVPEVQTHEEESAAPTAMLESEEHGMYILETSLESSVEHDVHVMFHVNGEMLQADFVVQVSGTNSRAIVLWSFGVINVALIAAAGVMKKQPVVIRGK